MIPGHRNQRREQSYWAVVVEMNRTASTMAIIAIPFGLAFALTRNNSAVSKTELLEWCAVVSTFLRGLVCEGAVPAKARAEMVDPEEVGVYTAGIVSCREDACSDWWVVPTSFPLLGLVGGTNLVPNLVLSDWWVVPTSFCTNLVLSDWWVVPTSFPYQPRSPTSFQPRSNLVPTSFYTWNQYGNQ